MPAPPGPLPWPVVTGTTLARFFASFQQAARAAVDPRLALDDAIAAERDLPGVLRDLDGLMTRSPDEPIAQAHLQPLLGGLGLPDGPGYRQWLLSVRDVVRDHVAGAVAGGAAWDARVGDEPPTLPRASRFTDQETANWACTEVLRRNERAFRGWAADAGGWQRQHYYAGLGRPVGTVMSDPDAGGAGPSCAVVVMSLDSATGRPFILTAYPELTLDSAVRERLPDLCHWFGGFFGQDLEHPWAETRAANLTTGEPARARMRSQLDELLTLDDVNLRQAVEAFGSYVLPSRLRAWVEATRWRLDAFDWFGGGRPVA